MDKQKLVSVIIPTFNGSDLIVNAVESVLAQDYTEIEVIVVDDNARGTTEQYKTEMAMKAYKDDPRVSYIVHEKNMNGAAARNTGFAVSKGKYITFLDDDDIYYPSKVRVEVDALDKLSKEWGLVYCSVEKYTEGRFTSINKAIKSGELLKKLLLHQVVIGSDSLMVRREVFEELNGFDESFRRHQDYEFTARIAAKYKIRALAYPGVRYNIMRRNSPKTSEQAIKYRSHYIEKMLPYIQRYSLRSQNYIIYYNMIDFVGYLVKRGRLLHAYHECNKIASPWLVKNSPYLFISAVLVKAYFKVKSKLRDMIYFLIQKPGKI